MVRSNPMSMWRQVTPPSVLLSRPLPEGMYMVVGVSGSMRAGQRSPRPKSSQLPPLSVLLKTLLLMATEPNKE